MTFVTELSHCANARVTGAVEAQGMHSTPSRSEVTMKTKLALTLLLAALLPAAALAAPPAGRHHGHGILYSYSGTLAAAPSGTSLTVDVETGNRPALKS